MAMLKRVAGKATPVDRQQAEEMVKQARQKRRGDRRRMIEKIKQEEADEQVSLPDDQQ